MLIHFLYVAAGIGIYAAINHITAGLKPLRDSRHLLFGGACLLEAVFVYFHVQTLQASDVGEFVTSLKWSLAAVILTIVLLLWSMALYIAKRPKVFLIATGSVYFLLFAVNLLQPYSLQYEYIDGIYFMQLPWGESVTRGTGQSGFWMYFGLVMVIATFGYCAYGLLVKYRKSRNKFDLWMLLASASLLIFMPLGVLVRLSVIHLIEPGVIGFMAMLIVMSITLTLETRKRMISSEEKFRTIIEKSPIGLAMARDGVTVGVNEVYLKMFGYDTLDEVYGRPLLDQIAPQCRKEVAEKIKRRIAGDEVESTYETQGQRRDGSQFPLQIVAKRIVLNDGPLTFGFLMDVSQRKKAEEEITRLAFYDQLTNLPNRRMLIDRLQGALLSNKRSGYSGALMLIDLDDFKTLNDSYGHAVGDALLQQLAARLVSCVREADLVSRLGGDEFAVLLENLSDDPAQAAEQARNVAEKFFRSIDLPFNLEGHEYKCLVSAGISMLDAGAIDANELLKQADIAMYHAQDDGRNLLRFFDPDMQAAILARSETENALHKALAGGQLYLYYQIQIDHAHAPVGAEALIRWIHPEKGFIPPSTFIPVAEETGLIRDIGQWVLDAACAQLKIWSQSQLTCSIELSVNVSAKQFHQLDFVDQVKATVAKHGIDPKRLKLELTESMLLGSVEQAIETMVSLREIGIRFSLDDFGTGYSSLQYLKQLPLYQLKIDQSFVRNLASDENDRTIVRTIIAMAQSLGLEVIAEGVETELQRNVLLSHGCVCYQGYLFGKPAAIEEFEALLKSC